MKKISNKVEFDELIDKISECMKWHDRINFEDKVYNLLLDNGEELRIVFSNSSLAHLLGVDTEYLKTTGLFKGNSYDILKMVCNDSYRLYSMVRGGHLTFDNFISDFALEKVNGFRNVCGIDLYNIEFICKYSKENSYITGHQQLEGDYYIAYKTENGLFIIGLKKNGDYYYPMTNRFIDLNDEKSKKFLNVLLNNQCITMATYSYLYFKNTNGKSNKIYVDYIKKAHVIRKLKEYANNYGSIVDVSTGYGYIIEKLLQKFESNSNIYPILNKIFEYIGKRVKINIDKLEKEFGKLPDEMLVLINTYNDSLSADISSALGEYTKEVTRERDQLKEENRKNIEELERLKEELLAVKSLNEKLQMENAEYNAGYKEIEGTIRRVLSIKG